MDTDIVFTLLSNGLGFSAQRHGRQIGEITFVRIGTDKFIIDHTAVDSAFRNKQIGLNLVRCVCNLARSQHRKIIAMCPFAQAMFNRYSEFDDVRLLNAH